MSSSIPVKTASAPRKRQLFLGSIVTPVSLLELRYVKAGALGVDTDGVIQFVEDIASDHVEGALRDLLDKHGWKEGECEVVEMKQGEFLCPGLIDTHTVSRLPIPSARNPH
jgi:guanine deaminase